MPTHMRIDHESLAALSREVMTAWGFSPEQAGVTAENLVAADLFGIDSHGVHMLPVYEEMLADGRVEAAPQIHVARPGPGVVQIDAGGGLGHVAARKGMSEAVNAARTCGVGVTSVRNSGHFGAAGIYALQASDEGMLGIAMSAVAKVALAPSGSRRAWFGTNPIAFAAPCADGTPFLLDMATTTASVGRIMRAEAEGEDIPSDWALGADGNATTSPREALSARLLTPLGGVDAGASYKGYGLTAMVEILSTFLAGATWAPRREQGSSGDDVGHFFLALDPSRLREADAFRSDVSHMNSSLRESPTFASERGLKVPGDREFANRAHRQRHGIPLDASVHDALRGVADRAGVDAQRVLGPTA